MYDCLLDSCRNFQLTHNLTSTTLMLSTTDKDQHVKILITYPKMKMKSATLYHYVEVLLKYLSKSLRNSESIEQSTINVGKQ